MTTRPTLTNTRLGLGVASLVLAAMLFLGFRAPQAVTAIGAGSGTGSAGGSNGTTGTSGGSSTGGSNGTTGSTGGSTGGSGGTGGSGTAGSGSNGSGSAKSGTFDGTAVDVNYGIVQVEITVSGGKVTKVTELSMPSGGRSGRIAAYAAPILEQEALTAQTAQIDIVSGATYTSEGFAESLQAALNEAGL